MTTVEPYVCRNDVYLKYYFDGEVSDLGKCVFDILCEVYRGQHHIPFSRGQHIKGNKKRDWSHPNYIEFVIFGELATFDGDELVRLVVKAFREGIRLSIEAVAPKYMKLTWTNHGLYFERGGKITTEFLKEKIEKYSI